MDRARHGGPPQHRVIYLVRYADGLTGAFESEADARLHAALEEDEGRECEVYSCALLRAGSFAPAIKEAMKSDDN